METINMKQARSQYRQQYAVSIESGPGGWGPERPSFRAYARTAARANLWPAAVGKLATIIAALALFMGCAPADHDLTPEAGPQAGAAAVGVNSEALLSTNSCGETLDQMRQRHRNFISTKLTGSWTWAGALSASTWYGSGSGGRTAQATVNPSGNETLTYMRRIVSRSQGNSCVAVSQCVGTTKHNQWGCP